MTLGAGPHDERVLGAGDEALHSATCLNEVAGIEENVSFSRGSKRREERWPRGLHPGRRLERAT